MCTVFTENSSIFPSNQMILFAQKITLWSLPNFCIMLYHVFFFFFETLHYSVKSFTVKLISRNNSQVIQKFRKLHTAVCDLSVEKREILCHQKNISSNQLFSNLFSKTVTFTKFLPKMRESKFPEFSHCAH